MTENVRKSCVIGWPAGHSRSPIIHGYWIKQHGIAGAYGKEAVPPEAFADFVKGLAARGYVGANVTIPHKEAALSLAVPDARAKAVGAANTLWFENGVLHATNTDVEGFLACLDVASPHWVRSVNRALVIGAGGAAHAVVFGLIARGVTSIYVVNRHFERAVTLKAKFGEVVHPAHWHEVDGLLADAHLLVNATSLGMKGQPALEIDVAKLPADALVADLVYVPLVTPLLAAARKRGLRTADGLDMLLHQAVRGFERWFGVTPHVTGELRTLVEADLGKT